MADFSDLDIFEDFVKKGEGDQYTFRCDIIAEGIEEEAGFNLHAPEWQAMVAERKNGDDSNDLGGRMNTYRINEYARLKGVSVTIIDISNPGNGYPDVEFSGSFDAIFELALAYNGLEDQPGMRDVLKAKLEG